MRKKDNSLKILLGIIVAILVMCTVLLMAARGNDYTMALDQYGIFTKYLGWNSLGTVLGRGLTDEARTLGASIK